MKQIAYLFVFFLYCHLGFTQEVRVKAELDSANIMIGDQVNLNLSVNFDRNVSIEKIDISVLADIDKVEVLQIGSVDTIPSNDLMMLQQRLTLTSFDSGYYKIPAIPISYSYHGNKGLAKTNELALNVNTFPIVTDSLHIEPIKPIIEEPLKLQDFLPYILGVFGLAGIIFLILYLIRRAKRKEALPIPEIIRPAHEIALDKLMVLDKAKLWQQGEIKQYQSELTYIIREYLENRFSINALESTTDEIIAQLKAKVIESDWQEKLKKIFQTADLVKFAKAEPPAELHATAMEQAEDFVVSTKETVLEKEDNENKKENAAVTETEENNSNEEKKSTLNEELPDN